ncbi:hypothetical protein N9M39_00610 [Halieaceae bacterium]|nr:hypothetical protein [Halieaceae bacterium]
MPNQTSPVGSRVRRAVNDLVLAEMFLVQATIESATAIGDGLSALGRQLGAEADEAANDEHSLGAVLSRTADEAIEPYTSRFRILRELLDRAN